MLPFHSPGKQQKIFDFLMFRGVLKKNIAQKWHGLKWIGGFQKGRFLLVPHCDLIEFNSFTLVIAVLMLNFKSRYIMIALLRRYIMRHFYVWEKLAINILGKSVLIPWQINLLKYCGNLLSFWLITLWGHFFHIFENDCCVMQIFSSGKISAKLAVKTFWTTY